MSDDDRSKWFVPIVVAVIAAIGTVIAALAPSLFGGGDDPAPSTPGPTSSASGNVPGTDRPTPREPAGPTATAVVAYSGNDSVTESDPAVDLDSPTDGTGGDNVGDVVHTDLALITGSGARITLLDRAQIPTLDTCRSALEERGADTIATAQLEDGVPVCIKTTAGRIGALTRTSLHKYGDPPKLNIFLFDYVIWKAAPG
ncbi:MAG: hypothetical protein ACRDTE_07020 [Pseudonocardiaceae bacterium]